MQAFDLGSKDISERPPLRHQGDQTSWRSKKQMANEISERISLEKNKSVKGYASKVFKESSVSAVSAIVSTHNRPRKFFRILVFVLFTTGFLYQCVKFFTYILTYPTVVNIEIDRPTEYLAPAYTFCNYNRYLKNKSENNLTFFLEKVSSAIRQRLFSFPNNFNAGPSSLHPFYNDKKLEYNKINIGKRFVFISIEMAV
ncbi:uncharacterized protein TNIN_117681 [Trichonephila inaurata madagascariensis]|uniref:Uncharacterized protein n=1 Tax=Trichonephila inaurata madagascariensis TaxID=2747483 RepID=A0A8X7CGJ1_9ARAC|nr:uncharacterized protein TNIN_117681 [Trichonephila inaurata madagascariensis]